jgi:hypothetical protein
MGGGLLSMMNIMGCYELMNMRNEIKQNKNVFENEIS